MIRFWPAMKGFCYRKTVYFANNCEKNIIGIIFLRKSMVPGDALKFL